MKQLNTSKLRRLLLLTTAVLLLTALLSGCFGGDDTDDQVNNLPTGTQGTEAPTDAPTEPPTEAPTEAPAVMGTVNADNLNVRNLPSMDSEVLKQLDVNTRVEILEQETIGNIVWGRIAEGWVNMNYVTIDGEEPVTPAAPDDSTDATEPEDDKDSTSSTDGKTGTITTSLNIRKGAGTSYDKVGSYKKGDKVTILETSGNWGRTDKGWISLKYVDGVSASTSTSTDTSTSTSSDGKTGTINTAALYIRKGAGSSYDTVGTYKKGDKVTILETKNNWGRTDKGWISLKYVDGVSGTTGSSTTTTTTTTSIKANDTVTINTGALNIRDGAGSSYKDVGNYAKGEKVKILEVKGNWGRTDKGWISLNYVTKSSSGSTTSNASAVKVNDTVTINASTLNIRKGAGTSYDKVGSYKQGDKVTILEIKGNWGRTDKGWIGLNYVSVSSSSSTSTTTYTTGTGKVTASTLNIREGAGTSHKDVGNYTKGDKVEILEVKGEWGRTSKGWISLKYVDMD